MELVRAVRVVANPRGSAWYPARDGAPLQQLAASGQTRNRSGSSLMRFLPSGERLQAAALAVLVTGTVSASLVLPGSSAAATTETPSELVASVYAAALAAGSFHYVDQQTLGINGASIQQTESGDVGRGEGVQFVYGRFGNSEAIVIGSVAYLKGNAAALQVDLLYPLRRADAYANRWISFTPKDEPYQLIVRLVLGTTSWAKPTEAPLDSLPERPNSISRPPTVDGRAVESVTSTIDDVVASTDSSFVGSAQVFFGANSPKLPYRLTDDTTGTEAGSPFSQQDSATFSKWSERVEVTPPTGALPYSSLPPPDAA